MILLMSMICAASGFTLPELPDLISTVGNVFGGNFTLKMVEEPKVFLPQVSQIESMTREESMERFHWFFCVYVLIFLDVTCVGSVIMVLGFCGALWAVAQDQQQFDEHRRCWRCGT